MEDLAYLEKLFLYNCICQFNQLGIQSFLFRMERLDYRIVRFLKSRLFNKCEYKVS